MANKNKNLHKANKSKNDEFYTQLSDIEKEVRHYKEHFKGKVVFCNCDDQNDSAIFRAVFSLDNRAINLFIFNFLPEDVGQFLETVWCFDGLEDEMVLKFEYGSCY